ncbi:hypothetical protein ACFSPU_02530 [Haoranjiania flava]|uniref:Lipoprotein n=1 Tax=Haoranjiania flava TaxID=1856322 RepID=A0AAE3LP42_9BACT|nr:hypothetical protein [Haoranjiania flava]MCU7693105.1 hypothetical protein [Haoranjiania flava]
MKKTIQILSVVLLSVFVLASCSKDTSPSERDVFAGKYNGKISYDGQDKKVSTTTGAVTVLKVGNNYNFFFSDGIPDLTGVEFQKDGETMVSIGSSQTNYIRITASTLKILFLKNGNVWTADCTR